MYVFYNFLIGIYNIVILVLIYNFYISALLDNVVKYQMLIISYPSLN